MIVWRMTYGFSRKDHELAVNFFVNATGFSNRNIKDTLKQLLKLKVLTETQSASYNRTRKLAFNKNYDEWLVESRSSEKEVKQSSPGEAHFTSSGDVQFTSSGEAEFTQERNKEIKKEEEEKSMNNHDAFQKIADKFIQRRARGLVLSKKDEESINRLLEDNIPLDKILFLIDVVFDEYKPKHRLDYIAKFEYVEKGVLDRYHNEKKKRSNLDVLDEIASKYEME